MNNNPNLPRKFDAILGGSVPPPFEGVVLGGLEGVKSRLKSTVVEARVAAVCEAINYGEAGLDVVIEALKDAEKQVQLSASQLLRERGGIKGKQALLDYEEWLFFTTLQNWKAEEFNPKIGITEPNSKAYIVNLDHLKLLLQDPKVTEVEALICQMSHWGYFVNMGFYTFAEILVDAHQQLTNLKSLFIGDVEEDIYREDRQQGNCDYNRYRIELGDISLILDAYPNLEVLQVRGCSESLECALQSHKHLRTLIIETGNITNKSISQIFTLHLPTLEYFELWLGKANNYYSVSTNKLLPLLLDNSFPNLTYLGLRNSEYTNDIAMNVAQSPIIERLAVLDLSMGALTDDGAEALLNCQAINRLHTLNVSLNRLSPNMIQQLSQLNCRVIA